jgi:hypothetical protein
MSRQECAKRLAELELDLVVIYAIGDGDGPLRGEVKIGLSSRRAFAEEVKAARVYRSSEVVTHFAHVVRGRAVGLRLRSALEASLRSTGRHKRNSWWAISGDDACVRVLECARTEKIELLTDSEAAVIEADHERAIRQRRMDRDLGGV